MTTRRILATIVLILALSGMTQGEVGDQEAPLATALLRCIHRR
jgi:hypothetical protein